MVSTRLGSAMPWAILLLLAQPGTAHAQGVPEKLEREFVGTWLIIIGGEIRSRTLDVRELAVRSDGSFLLDAKYGWTIGRPVSPVTAEVYGTPGSYTFSITTPTGSVIVSKQTGAGSFGGSFTYSGGSRSAPVELKRASAEEVQARVDNELRESSKGNGFALENKDWGIAATDMPRTDRPHAPTPRQVNGAKTVTTLELYRWLDGASRPVLIDVLDGRHESLRGALWLPRGGYSGDGAEVKKFAAALEKIAGGNKAKPMVFFCLNSECWLSYNAVLRARTLGYSAVAWYRGGTAAWHAAEFPMARLTKEAW